MKRLVLLLLLLCAAFAADFSWADDESWLVVLEYDNGAVSVVEQKALAGPAPSAPAEGDYSFSVKSSGSVIFEESFDFPLITLYDAPSTELFSDDGSQLFTPDDTDVIVFEDKAQVELIIPKSAMGDTLSVKDSGGTVVVDAPMVEIIAPPGVTPPGVIPPGVTPPGVTPPPGGDAITPPGNTTVLPDGNDFLMVLGVGFLVVAAVVVLFAVGFIYVIFRVFGSKKNKPRKKKG